MADHTYLLIKEIKDPLADIIKKLTLSYSYWFNRKYATYTLGIAKPKDMSDEEAIERIKEISGLDACNRLATLDKANRDRILHLLKKEGFTIRQISRLTEINHGIVQKADDLGL